MRRTAKVARRVQALLPGKLGCVGGVLFNPIYEYVVNGIIVDGTPYKNTVVAKRVHLVFFKTDTSLSLNYSRKFYNTVDETQVSSFYGQVGEIANQIAATLLSSGFSAEILKPYTLHDFLDEHCSTGIPSHYNGGRLFDMCCAAFLVGNTKQAREGFRQLKREWDQAVAQRSEPLDPYREDRRREADEIAALLDGSDAALRQHIIDNIERNAPLLGFQAVGRGSCGT